MSQDYENPTTQWPGAEPGGYRPTEQMGQAGQQAGYGPAGMAGPQAKTELLDTTPPTFAWVVIREGMRAGKIYHLNPDDTTIGRDTDCDVILDDSAISRQHVKIRVLKNSEGEQEFVLHDLATPNGTKLNGEEVVKHPLKDGDRIEIGRTVLVFKKVD
ncbi:MAG: FHA domain-containing protein [Anaerolineae bacterium]|nr:FHA domain-containing protein [Anaerolineae bacterium]